MKRIWDHVHDRPFLFVHFLSLFVLRLKVDPGMGARKTVMGDIGVTNGRTLKFQAHHAIRIGFQKLKKDVGIEILKNVPLCLRL